MKRRSETYRETARAVVGAYQKERARHPELGERELCVRAIERREGYERIGAGFVLRTPRGKEFEFVGDLRDAVLAVIASEAERSVLEHFDEIRSALDQEIGVRSRERFWGYL